MSDLLARAASLFVAPAAPRPAPVAVIAERLYAPRAVVLGTRRTAPALAAAVAGELRRPDQWPAAIVAVWTDADHDRAAPGDAAWEPVAGWSAADAEPVPRAESAPASPRGSAPATRAARRLSERLAACGLAARARGRLAWVDLPADVAHAVAAAERAASLDVPMTIAVAGPRPAALEPLLREPDLVVVAATPAEAPIAELAREDLASGEPPVVVLEPPTGAARRLALAGRGRLRHPDAPLATLLRDRT